MEPNQIHYKGQSLGQYLDRLDFVQAEAGQAFQKANTLETRITTAQAEAAGANAQGQAALKSAETTQKLLKELIDEIKDLREEGELQQKQIDALKQDMNEFKNDMDIRFNDFVREVKRNGGQFNSVNITTNGGYYGTQCWDTVSGLLSYIDEYNNQMIEVTTNNKDGGSTKIKAKVREIEESTPVSELDDESFCG